MKEVTVNILCVGAAFDGNQGENETVRILRDLANKIEKGERPGLIFDVNGNPACTVGYNLSDEKPTKPTWPTERWQRED